MPDAAPRYYRNIAWFTFIHVAALASLPVATPRALVVMVALLALIVPAIGVGWHRCLAHRAFKTHLWIRRAIGVTGALAFQRGPVEWVAVHRMHHAETETDRDPHSAARGLWHSHVGWLLRRPPQFYNERVRRAFARDLLADPVMVALDRDEVFFALQALLFAALYLTLGLPEALFGTAVRLVVHYHLTFAVNSLCHTYEGRGYGGYRNFATPDRSTNVWWLALLTFGEGWHNNHHADPAAALNGRRRLELDAGGLLVLAAERLHLVWDVRRPLAAQASHRDPTARRSPVNLSPRSPFCPRGGSASPKS